jgi:hypothetical protein
MIWFISAFLLIAIPCLAAPPPNADPRLQPWFDHQHSVGGDWCCHVADGHILSESDWRASGDHYEVRINGIWHSIPNSAVRDPNGGPNPTGHAVAWWVGSGDELAIVCFAQGTEL